MMRHSATHRSWFGMPASGDLRRPGRSSNRRGSILVLIAILTTMLFAMLAFAVDVGYILHARTALQRSADACAFAAAGHLPDQSSAASAAMVAAEENSGEGGPDLDLSNMEFGYWDRDTATFTTPTPDGRSTNAARVTLMQTNASANPLNLFFARVLGSSTADVSATATAMYDRWLCGPFVGIDWLSVPGGPQADSYDSREGGYSSATARDRGSICSDGPVGVDGAALVRGDARAGKGHHVTMAGGATVTGSIGSRLKPLDLPPVDASEAALDNDNANVPQIPEGNSWKSPVDASGNFLLDGDNSITLPPGTYYFNDFVITGQSALSISGPTTIYLTGNLERSGGSVVNNTTQKPGDLQFLMTGGTATITSNNAFYGVVYAPNTHVTIDGDSDFYGAVIGKTLTVTGSGAGHYDESLNLGELEFPRRTALVD